LTFREDVDSDRANYHLALFDRLTYQQLCILKIFGSTDGRALRDQSYRGQEAPSAIWSALQQVNELVDLNLLVQGSTQSHKTLLRGAGSIVPNKILLSPLGKEFSELFDLANIPEETISSTIRSLNDDGKTT
jgi:hypothetical protein